MARLRAALLAARDARQALLGRLIGRHLGRHLGREAGAVLTAALNLPGAEKSPPGAEALLRWALGRLAAALPGVAIVHEGADALGPFALLTAEAGPREAKAACLAVEADPARPAARLVDLDAYGPDGAAVDRAALGLPQRPCLLCDAPARECIRAARHDPAAVAARARALLAEFAP